MRLTQSKFASWLRAKPPSEVVGRPHDCIGCPIAQFYYETSGGCRAVVSSRGGVYVINRGGGDRRVPRWAEDFAFQVDCESALEVSAGRALEILTAVAT
jgi:hypothetical protein